MASTTPKQWSVEDDEASLRRLQHRLRSIQPAITFDSVQTAARLGELKAVLNHVQHCADNGASGVGLAIQFDTTVAELKRRRFTVEPGEKGFLVSWLPQIDLTLRNPDPPPPDLP